MASKNRTYSMIDGTLYACFDDEATVRHYSSNPQNDIGVTIPAGTKVAMLPYTVGNVETDHANAYWYWGTAEGTRADGKPGAAILRVYNYELR